MGLFRVLSTMKSLHPNTKLLIYKVNIFIYLYFKLLNFKLDVLMKSFWIIAALMKKQVSFALWMLSNFIKPNNS